MTINKNCGVYKITNKANNRVYYGASKNLTSRFSNHRHYMHKGEHSNPGIADDVITYGADIFEFDVVTYCDEADRFKIEGELIDQHIGSDDCYNLWDGSRKPVEEVRERIAEGNRGKTLSEAHRKALRDANLGKKLSPAHKKALFASFVGKPKSELHKQRISAALTGKTKTEDHKRKIGLSHRQALLAIDPSGIEQYFTSMGEAANELGMTVKTLRLYMRQGISSRSKFNGWEFIKREDFSPLQAAVYR